MVVSGGSTVVELGTSSNPMMDRSSGIRSFFSFAASIASQQADSGSARISLGSGLALVTVPFALGAFADKVGLWSAYTIVAVLLLVIVVIVTFANRSNDKAGHVDKCDQVTSH